ncbi:MAG TPA: dCTP deaminase [Candidatus Saccharimonadia bacterium]|nr:dCTP deaminase [Candidatus Saccharimonadia bacterium]
MSILSNLDIEQAINDDHIVCLPFNPKHVSQASLDVTLGSYYYRIERYATKTVYNPFDREDVERYFDGPYKAISHKQWCLMNGFTPLKNISPEHPIIVLKPGERILAHTHEFLGIRPPGAYELRARSSWARNGIAVCFDAGFVDPGYINRLTLEIYNLNSETIAIPVGERIAQAVFHETGEVRGNYGIARDGGFSGKYQQGEDLEAIIKTWTPESILPKAYNDSRELPRPIEGSSYV